MPPKATRALTDTADAKSRRRTKINLSDGDYHHYRIDTCMQSRQTMRRSKKLVLRVVRFHGAILEGIRR